MSTSEAYDIMDETAALFTLINGGPAFLKPGLDDCSVVLLATGLIENFLRVSLISIFRADAVSKKMIRTVFEGHGALSTFSAKIEVCAGLGNITEEVRNDLKIVKDVRNSFAHSVSQLHLKDFNACRSLKLRSKLEIHDECKEREMFKQSCAGIIGRLSLGTIFQIATARFVSANKEGIMREYESIIEAL
jgi:DNA-binding MltR family transcriptional regulator